MSHGHLPGEGPYGKQLQKAVDYVISLQKRNGMLAIAAPNGGKLSRSVNHTIGTSSAYNHAFSGLLLSETYGLQGSPIASKIRTAVRKALEVTLKMQGWPKNIPDKEGGWRYLQKIATGGADVSITGWQLMFLRSAKNAGFEIPKVSIDAAVGYVCRSFRADSATFLYGFSPRFNAYKICGVTGAGILALPHAGLHNTPEA